MPSPASFARGRAVSSSTVALLFDSAKGVSLSPRLRRTGYVFQDARLFPHMSVEDNLLFGWRRARKKRERRARSRASSALLGLEHLAPAPAARVFPAAKRAASRSAARFCRRPTFCLLDEPLAALDAARRAEILPYLERLRDEARLPMLYVSHALDEVARLAHDIVVLRDGRVVRQGSVFDVLTELELPAFAGTPPLGAVHRSRGR